MKSDVKNFLEYKFEIIKLLRQSDKSKIYLAQSRADNKLVVIKFLKSVGLPYNALKKISHKILPKIFYYAEDVADSVVVEEFLQGESLAERKNFISVELAQKILLQLCDGLKVLHANKIIHRDIKPSNLILQNDEIIRLIDFDAARIFDSDKKHDTHFLGTKGYAPPEQFGYGQTDSRSDIFSLGMTIFELLGDNCDSRLKKILSKCTELDPKNRFQSVEELKSALLEKKSSHKKFFASLLLIIIILSFANSTYDEKIPLPEENSTEKNVPIMGTFEKKSESPPKKFEFPEIKMPQENIPTQNFDLPKITLPDIKPPPQKNIPAEKIPEPVEVTPIKNYVKVKYWLNNTRSAEWTDNFDYDITNAVHDLAMSETIWSKWKSAGNGAIIFPDYKIYIEAQNFSAGTFTNPQVNLVYNDNGRVETKTFYGASIAPGGGKINFTIPLGDFRVDNPRVAGDTWRTFNTITVYFSGSGAEIIGSQMQYDFIFVSQKRWNEEHR